MRALAAMAMLATACTADRANQQANAAHASAAIDSGKTEPGTSHTRLAANKPATLGSGLVLVHGGELLQLRGASIQVDHVVYLNQPCPPDVQCFHSGVLKLVAFHVTHSGAAVAANVEEGASRVVDGVELRVVSVREGPEAKGPEAQVEANLPLARAP